MKRIDGIDPSELQSVKSYHIEQEALQNEEEEESHIAQPTFQAVDDVDSSNTPQLWIMPKLTWKRLRNKYLKLQRKEQQTYFGL